MKKDIYKVIRRPIITEKGLGVKETQRTVVFEVAPAATKTEIKEAVQKIFKVKVEAVRTAIYPRKIPAARPFRGAPARLEKAYIKLGPDEKMIEYAENL